MNDALDRYARQTIKEGLSQLPESWQMLFKKLYAKGDLEKPIDEVVDLMDADRLDGAMLQVERSLAKIKETSEEVRG